MESWLEPDSGSKRVDRQFTWFAVYLVLEAIYLALVDSLQLLTTRKTCRVSTLLHSISREVHDETEEEKMRKLPAG